MKRNTMIAAIVVCMALIFATVASANSWGFAEPSTPPVSWGFAPEAGPVMDLSTTQRATPDWEQVFAQEDCPGGVCPLPTQVSVACPNCPQPMRVVHHGSIASEPAPVGVVPHGYHAHRAFDGSVVVHHNSNFGDLSAHRGMSLVRIAEGGQSISQAGTYQHAGVFRRGNGHGLLGLKPRPWGWRIRAFFRR